MSRTERFLQLQNMKAHYKNIVLTNPTYHFEKSPKKKYLEKDLQRTKKVDLNKYQEIYNQNSKLVSNLRQIRTRKFKGQKQSDNFLDNLKINQTVHPNQEGIQHQNMRFVKKLREITPSIGSRSEWKKHFKNYNQQRKKLTKVKPKETKFSKQAFQLNLEIQNLKKKLTTSSSKGTYYKSRRRIDSQRFYSINLKNQSPPSPQHRRNELLESEDQQQLIKDLKILEIYTDDYS